MVWLPYPCKFHKGRVGFFFFVYYFISKHLEKCLSWSRCSIIICCPNEWFPNMSTLATDLLHLGNISLENSASAAGGSWQYQDRDWAQPGWYGCSRAKRRAHILRFPKVKRSSSVWFSKSFTIWPPMPFWTYLLLWKTFPLSVDDSLFLNPLCKVPTFGPLSVVALPSPNSHVTSLEPHQRVWHTQCLVFSLPFTSTVPKM